MDKKQKLLNTFVYGTAGDNSFNGKDFNNMHWDIRDLPIETMESIESYVKILPAIKKEIISDIYCLSTSEKQCMDWNRRKSIRPLLTSMDMLFVDNMVEKVYKKHTYRYTRTKRLGF